METTEDILREHDRILAVLPDKMESLTLAVDKLTEKIGLIETLIERDRLRDIEVNKLSDKSSKLEDTIIALDKKVARIYTIKNIIIWVIGISLAIIDIVVTLWT